MGTRNLISGNKMRTLIDGVTKHKVALIIIFVFYVVLFIKAGSKSYWLDELFSVYMRGIAHESFREHFNFIRIANPVIPLYEVTLYAWMRVFGDTELATRSLSILFVSISAIFLYLFTLRIFNKRTATTSVLLFLFSNLIVMYALEARYYGQMLFLTTLSSYILLLYSESFCINFSWKNIFINGYFPVLTLVNMALMLNHTFNYLFLAVQALFLTFFMLTLKTTDRWYVKIVKVLLVYLTPLLLIALLWPPTIKYIFNPELLSYMHNVIKSVLHTATPGISLTEIVIISLVLISVVLALRKIIPRFVNVHRKNKLVQYFLNAYNRRQVLPIFLIIPLVVIFFMDFRTLGIMSQEGLHNPSQIFLNNLVYFTLSPPKFADILLLFFMLFVVIRQSLCIHRAFITNNKKTLTRRLFLVYLLLLILLPCIFTSLVYSFMGNRPFYPRYILMCIPPLMIFLSFSIQKGILIIDNILKRFSNHSIKRFYLRYSLFISVLILIIVLAPRSYLTITRIDNNSWRDISKQVVNVIQSDTDHNYVVVETVFRRFPLLDYYFKRYSKSIRVGFVIENRENLEMATESGFEPELFKTRNLKQIEENDYMIITFTHDSKDNFIKVLEFLNGKYKEKIKFLDGGNHGFIIFDLHPERTHGNVNP